MSPSSFRAALVDDRAIGTDLGRKFVFVVDEQNVVQYRPVVTGRSVEGLRVIKEGLEPGDVVIVNGLQRVRPGVAVNATQVAMDRGSPGALSSASRQRTTETRRAQRALRRQTMGFSQFFVRRPIFAARAVGDHLHRRRAVAAALADQRVPRGRAADGRRARDLSRREPAGDRRDRRGAARAGDQRRREHALHVVAVDDRRADDAHRDVRARHGPRQSAGAGPEPRLADAAEAARGHAAARRDDREGARPISRCSCT